VAYEGFTSGVHVIQGERQGAHTHVSDVRLKCFRKGLRIHKHRFMAIDRFCVRHDLSDVMRIKCGGDFVLGVQNDCCAADLITNGYIGYELKRLMKAEMLLTVYACADFLGKPPGDKPLEQIRHINHERLQWDIARNMRWAGSSQKEVAEPMQPLVILI
jgi:hypothetical protein